MSGAKPWTATCTVTSTSTSFHHLNADRGLAAPARLAYLALNWVNNRLPYYGVDDQLEIRDYVCQDVEAHWPRLFVTSSPSRKLSDLFWMTLPWEAIERELGVIHVLDTGCGSGNYGPRLMAWSGHRIASYTGIDVVRQANWDRVTAEYPRCRFVQADAGALQIPDDTTLVVSQSAIEHVDHDLAYFTRIRRYLDGRQRSFLQVHLVPSQACLRLYGPHGVRQYTPRTLSKITRLFHAFSYSVLWRLGGAACNQLHYEFITKPVSRGIGDVRNMRPERYDEALRQAIRRDMAQPQRDPGFYALVIHSYPRERIEF